MNTSQLKNITTDVLVIGAGGAGMYAAIAAARNNARVVLLDKNMIGRGGATIMAQMTVAAALAEQEPDDWQQHLADTLAAGRGLCDESLATVLCQRAPERMREMDDWGVGWARNNGHISQVMAPGHRRSRCCYVDFLNTGPAVARTLRKIAGREKRIRRLSDVTITDLCHVDGRVYGAKGFEGSHGETVHIAASSVVIATGGLSKLYRRNSASNNMVGEGYALGLRAGAALTDMEFVQFFPIGHLAPRIVGMDPIMWDPFRYKLGGRLLNGLEQEFMQTYGAQDDGTYTAPRDTATFAILKENEAGRGSPHGGAWLSFTHIAEQELRAAFGPVIDRLADNGIDLLRDAVEVAPIAHYHMGGLKVDRNMQTSVSGLYAAGEAVGGASGANRLSGNAISEALVFGEIAGREAAVYALDQVRPSPAADLFGLNDADEPTVSTTQSNAPSAVSVLTELSQLMWDKVGPLRNASSLQDAWTRIGQFDDQLRQIRVPSSRTMNLQRADWFELRAALLVARSVTVAALKREESRGAHQRDDFPQTLQHYAGHQCITLDRGHDSVADALKVSFESVDPDGNHAG